MNSWDTRRARCRTLGIASLFMTHEDFSTAVVAVANDFYTRDSVHKENFISEAHRESVICQHMDKEGLTRG